MEILSVAFALDIFNGIEMCMDVDIQFIIQSNNCNLCCMVWHRMVYRSINSIFQFRSNEEVLEIRSE